MGGEEEGRGSDGRLWGWAPQIFRARTATEQAGRVFTPLRANRTSEHFEMLVFLRAFERGL
jgi:hypothetical protein